MITHEHAKDSDCAVGDDGCCIICGVSHSCPCEVCGGAGFHEPTCVELVELEIADLNRQTVQS